MIISFGEILWDVFPDGRRLLGGAPFNLACRLALLGRRSLMASRLGRDDPGKRACEEAAGLGVDTSLVQWDDELPTGTVRVSLDEAGRPDFFIVPEVAYERIEPTEALLEAAGRAECICYGTLAQRTKKNRDTLCELLEAASSALKFLDINLRRDCYDSRTVNSSLERAGLLKLNDDEVRVVAGIVFGRELSVPEFARLVIHACGLRACLVTLGERGVFAAEAGGAQVYAPGYRVKVVDTVGSGDAFSAGFIHSWLAGRSLAHSCDFGNRLGALVAATAGATARIAQEEIKRIGSVERITDPAFEELDAK